MKRKYILGTFIVIVGVLMLLQTLGYLNFSLWNLWPVILIYFAVDNLITNRTFSIFSAIIGLLGVVFLLENFHVFEGVSASGVFWAVVVILVGLSMIFKGSFMHQKYKNYHTTTDKDFTCNAVFSGAERRVVSDHFTGGETMAVFGGTEIDLRECQIADGSVIFATAVFGGVELKLPQNCEVVIDHEVEIFGGVESKCFSTAGAPKVIIVAKAVFGGVELHN